MTGPGLCPQLNSPIINLKKMKKTFAVLAFGLFVTGSAMAQQAPQQERKHRTEQHDGNSKRSRLSPEARATRQTEKMSKELGLNKSQTRKLQALNLEKAQQREAMRAQYKSRGERPAKNERQEIKAAHEKWNAELKDILTKKQYAQYQEQREEMRAQHKQRRDGVRSRGDRQRQRS